MGQYCAVDSSQNKRLQLVSSDLLHNISGKASGIVVRALAALGRGHFLRPRHGHLGSNQDQTGTSGQGSTVICLAPANLSRSDPCPRQARPAWDMGSMSACAPACGQATSTTSRRTRTLWADCHFSSARGPLAQCQVLLPGVAAAAAAPSTGRPFLFLQAFGFCVGSII